MNLSGHIPIMASFDAYTWFRLVVVSRPNKTWPGVLELMAYLSEKAFSDAIFYAARGLSALADSGIAAPLSLLLLTSLSACI